MTTTTARTAEPAPRQRRALQHRLLDNFHRRARRDLAALGADATALRQLEALVERQRAVLWRGRRAA